MIPLGDESPTKKRPFVTWSLVAVNAAVFAISISGGTGENFTAFTRQWGFTPTQFSLVTLFTSMFLHGDFFHIAGNMLYLWIFGDNVEDTLGHLGYLGFYLGAGLLAGLAHYASDPSSAVPAVGASGAISGVLGAYIILYPHNRVKVMWWWYWYVRVFKVPAGWLLGFYFVLQVVMAVVVGGEASVAYWAHIGGFVIGAAATLVLLAANLIVRPPRPVRMEIEPGSALQRAAAEEGLIGADDDGIYVKRGAGGAVTVTHVLDRVNVSTDADKRIKDILTALSSGESERAVKLIQVELRIPAKSAASAMALAKVADSFYQAGIYQMALHVYHESIRRFGEDDARLAEVKYRAGIIAARHVRDFTAAQALLADAAARHDNSDRRAAAQRELARVKANLARTGISEDGELISGPCAVVRQTAEMINVARVGRIVADVSGQPMADVTRLLRGSIGFVATGLEAVQAKQVASRLQEIDIPVLVIPEEKLVALPDAKDVARAAVLPHGVEFKLENLPALSKSWDEIFYASAGIVGFSSRKRVLDEFSGGMPQYVPLGIGHAPAVRVDGGQRWRYKETTKEKLVLAVFTLKPFECYRLIEDKVDLAGSPQALTMSQRLNFRRLVSALLAEGRDVPVNEGVKLVAADAPQREWRRLTFNSIRDFERYNYWRLQLEQYG